MDTLDAVRSKRILKGCYTYSYTDTIQPGNGAVSRSNIAKLNNHANGAEFARHLLLIGVDLTIDCEKIGYDLLDLTGVVMSQAWKSCKDQDLTLVSRDEGGSWVRLLLIVLV